MFKDFYSGKKVLVTGHTGFKGSWLVAWLQMLGAEVIGIALEPNTNPSHFEILDLSMESYFIDIRNYDDISKTIYKIKPEIIFHLAAQPLVRDSYDQPLYTFETNVIGTVNILNICRNLLDTLEAIVVVTSDKCYENKEWIWGYRENDSMGGYDPYSASKGCAELVTASYRNSYKLPVASARAGNVIGGGDWSKDRLIPDIIRSISIDKQVQIRNPNATRPWQHVLECLSGYLLLGKKLSQNKDKFASAWNFAPTDDGISTVLDIVKKMQSQWPKLQYKIDQSNHPHEANLLKLDCSKANAQLGWKNIWNLDKTIEVTTNWYRAFYEDKKNIMTLNDIKNYINDIENKNE